MLELRQWALEVVLTMAQVRVSLGNLIDSFRRFVKKIGSIQNPEYGVDISIGLPRIADYGNIQID